jgi:hypothetical protein
VTSLVRALAFAGLAVLAAACGSDDPDPPMPDPDLPPVDANPDGDPYPTDHLGGKDRSGTTPGDRIPNLTLRAYRNGTASGLDTLSLAEYYDPHQRHHKILHLQVAATWCAICSSELEATVTVTQALKARGIEFLEVVVSGQTAGKGPSLGELDGWIDRHKTNFPTAVDVAARRLGALGVSPGVMPHDILIDTRTMEILDSSPGAPLDVAHYVLDGLNFVEKNPPSYPVQ